MHYVAWLVAQGVVPYRDIFDMNVPGVYLLHLGVIRVLGEGDGAWRIFDLAWLGLTGAALFGFSRRMGDAWSGLGAALLFVLYHLSGGAARFSPCALSGTGRVGRGAGVGVGRCPWASPLGRSRRWDWTHDQAAVGALLDRVRGRCGGERTARRRAPRSRALVRGRARRPR